MNALDGTIWRSYVLLNKTPSGFQNIKNIKIKKNMAK